MSLSMQRDRVRIPLELMELEAVLWLPPDALGVVMFAHISNGTSLTPPNDYVGSVLRGVRLGTLWLEVLTPDEARGQQPRPGVDGLVRRLDAACHWLGSHNATAELPVGLSGAGEAAAAALHFAATRPRCISAVVTRGARADLTPAATLAKITVPTLLIAGSLDDGMIPANRSAYAALRCKKRLEIIPGATGSFEEPGCLEVVARHTRSWFLQNANLTAAQGQD